MEYHKLKHAREDGIEQGIEKMAKSLKENEESV